MWILKTDRGEVDTKVEDVTIPAEYLLVKGCPGILTVWPSIWPSVIMIILTGWCTETGLQ